MLKIPSIISEAKERIRQRSKQKYLETMQSIVEWVGEREKMSGRIEGRWTNMHSEVRYSREHA